MLIWLILYLFLLVLMFCVTGFLVYDWFFDLLALDFCFIYLSLWVCLGLWIGMIIGFVLMIVLRGFFVGLVGVLIVWICMFTYFDRCLLECLFVYCGTFSCVLLGVVRCT